MAKGIVVGTFWPSTLTQVSPCQLGNSFEWSTLFRWRSGCAEPQLVQLQAGGAHLSGDRAAH